jgi:hypothetical protein
LGNHLAQFIRLGTSIILFINLPNLWKDVPTASIIQILKKILIFHVYIQIIYVIVYNIGLHDFFNIITTYDERINLIGQNDIFSNHFFIVNIASGFPRFSGFFEEPAWFGWTLSLLIGIILQYQYKSKHIVLKFKDWSLIIIGFAFTTSVSALLSLIVISILYYIMMYSHHKVKIIAAFLCIFIAAITYVTAFNQSLLFRLQNIAEGSDGSTSYRIIGSLNGLLTLLANDPLTGYGLGDNNKSMYYEGLPSNAFHGIEIYNLQIIDMHNMLFQIICNLGIIGGILFLLLFHGLSFKKDCLIIVSLILTFFTVNVFNSSFLFVIISIAVFYFNAKKYNIKP